MPPEPNTDLVNQPAHYLDGRAIEITDLIEDWRLGWHLGNVMKYISRAGRKDDRAQDLQKARWYIKREISRLLHRAEPEVPPRMFANVTDRDVIEDWHLPGNLAGVVSCIFCGTGGVGLLQQAENFLSHELAAEEMKRVTAP